jgi:hypothetical protein
MRKNAPSLLLLLVTILITMTACCFSSKLTTPTANVAQLEEYLIDFSKKAEGYRIRYGSLPPDLDADKFFEMIRPYYRDDAMQRKVREYPVTVSKEDESYVLILCDKEARYILYKDLGKTIDYVDFPYWRQNQQVACPK